MLSYSAMLAYWTDPVISANVIVLMTLLGALALGLIVGYERSYHGRAAGMRTYGLVCMASAGLTVVAGYPVLWFGGHVVPASASDVSHIIQGIVTGIGFLGAGVIMREGFNISGLTTAASIWVAAVTGVLVGVGFYAAGIALALLSTLCMMGVARLEVWLPGRQSVAVTLRFGAHICPGDHELTQAIARCGYELNQSSVSIAMEAHKLEWRFVAMAFDRTSGLTLAQVARVLEALPGVESWHLAHTRN